MEKKKKNASKAPVEEAKKKKAPRKPLSPELKKRIAIIITASVLLLAICISLVFLVIIPAWKKDAKFDYLKSDLSKYINLTSAQYKNHSMALNIAKPREIDVDIALLSMRAADKDEKPLYDGVTQSDIPIDAGHIVNMYYRCYIVNDEGIPKTVFSNLTSDVYTSFEIGSGLFPSESFTVRGVENALVGIVPSEHQKFEKIKSGEVKDGQIIYLTFDRLAEGADVKETESGTAERIDLTSDKLDEAYGVGFKDAILGLSIGEGYTYSFSTTLDGKKCNYTDVNIEFATECERDALIVKGYLPYSTQYTQYKNKEVTVEIYIVSTQVYEAPELNDEYIKEKVAEVASGLRMDELVEYEGANLVEKYRAYAWEYLNEQYEEQLRAKIAENMWSYYIKTAEVKRVPGGMVDKIYREYYDEVKKSFEESGGVVENEMTGEVETYENLSDYAKIYLGLYYSEEDWTVTIRALAEDLVVERMIMYHIMKSENILPSDAELSAKVSEVKKDYMDEYIYQYLLDFENQREEFESSKHEDDVKYAEKMDRIIKAWKANDTQNEEYSAFYSEREAEMFSYYDDDHFVETAYYEWLNDYVVDWAEYTTLDTAADK